MKVILISDLFPNKFQPLFGIFNLERMKALQKQGCEVEIISPKNIMPPIKYLFPLPKINKIFSYINHTFSLKQKELIESFTVYNLKWFPIPRIISWISQLYIMHFFIGKKVKKIVTSFNPDMIICSVAHPEGTYSKYIRRYFNSSIIVIPEGSELLVEPKKYKGANKIINILNKYPDALVFVSEYLSDKIRKDYEIKNFRVVKNGYNSDIFYYKDKVTDNTKSLTNIITVGRFEYVKGYDLLIEAVSGIENIKLTIIGSGKLKKELEELVCNKNIKDKVQILGQMNQDEIRKFYDSADIFCMSSRSESFGIAAIEAMACGVPVVATKVGEMQYIIQNGINGFLAEKNSAESIKQNLLSAIKTTWDNKQIATIISEKYSWNKWATEILKLKQIHNK